MNAKRVTRTVITILLVAAALLAAAPAMAPVLAQGPVPQAASPAAPLPQFGPALDRLLVHFYQREQAMLAAQENHLTWASEAVIRAQELLDRAEAEGKDVAALDTALAAFQASLAGAQAAHDEAAAILAAHAGFDDSGQVCDRVAARHTLVQARQSLVEARRILLKAVRDLYRVVREWRRGLRAPATLQPGS